MVDIYMLLVLELIEFDVVADSLLPLSNTCDFRI
jgi:hypothetical protein